MIDQEMLQDLTESYLKSLVSEVSGPLGSDFDSSAAFGELGIDSFHVLKIIRRLEADFGTLPKSLLFEYFNINDLAKYFASNHEATLAGRFANELRRAGSSDHPADRQRAAVDLPVETKEVVESQPAVISGEAEPILMLEKDAYSHPDVRDLVRNLFERYKAEGSVSRGTRKIAPNLFIGSDRRGFLNYGRCRDLILVYGYTGPRDYLPTLLAEMYLYCEAHKFQFNAMGGDEAPVIGGMSFSATPFGAMQRITKLKEFTLDGGAMRRLRYQVSKFEKTGACRTEEYRCGTNAQTDRAIAGIIDRWCESRTMVNPLVHVAKAEILAGTLAPEHRVYLTWLDDVLQNAIVITAMSAEENGYLMDMEFYPPDMPLGGLEFAIVQIIQRLAAEGCDVLSLGGTYGCKLGENAHADVEIDRLLDDLRAQNIFNDQGNLQFKNKFRPENTSIYLCRPVGSSNPDSVIDVIMMIADPDKMQTSDEENHTFNRVPPVVAPSVVEPPAPKPAAPEPALAVREPVLVEGNERARTLAAFAFNPLNIPHEQVEIDLKSDSWSQLHMPAIETQMRHLHGRLQQPVNVDESLRAVFPFAHFVLTASGSAAEHLFFKAWPKKGLVLQNLLFPSTIYHQIDNGFEPMELPHGDLFQLDSTAPYKANLDLEALKARIATDPAAIACVCVEVGNNAAGGQPVSMQHLRDVKALLAPHAIPLVIDGTRVVENAQCLIELETEHAGQSVWAVVREIFSHADAVIGSLTKDFCVDKGGIIATNDGTLFRSLEALVEQEGPGIDVVDRKLIALSVQNRKHVETKVLRRMECVRLIWQALREHGVPVVQPAGGHCILIDVRQIAELKDLKEPVPSFVAWLYQSTGIRAGAHSVGMQKQTSINDLVRLAIPVGLTREEAEDVIGRLVAAFAAKVNIPEVVTESSSVQPSGVVYTNYGLIEYHHVSGGVPAAAAAPAPVAKEPVAPAPAVAASAAPVSAPVPAPAVKPAIEVPVETEAAPVAATQPRRRSKDIAIVGMAGRYPKARTSRELWQNLAAGRDCIEDLPADRLARRMQYGSSDRYRGGFIDDVERFDSLFFNISPREAEMLDPQERLFLEVAWEAVEDAGYYPEILAQEDGSRNIGVFVGAVWAMYQVIGVDEKHAGNPVAPNSFLWSIANRVSYALNLSGPSLTVDTACSSSLTAMYLACEAIVSGECPAAIVGGVNLDLHQAKVDINRVGGALSPDGVCRSFGTGANGYVAGEGIGALLLKPLDQAIADGDHVYGVIKSAAVNHGGRTSGYFVPNPAAQGNVVLSALRKANVDARSVGYIEAHGTGTELGDPIEIAGLSQAFSTGVAKQTCAIGSIKSNIGHLEAAAGVVSVAKVLLQMQHRQLAPSLHSKELNSFIDFASSPFYVPQRLQEWKAKEVDGVRFPLRAGISSFGAGGANAHVILESYEPAGRTKDDAAAATARIFPLSARNEDQLRESAVRLLAFLQQAPVDLQDTAHTLQHGRKSFEQRLAIVATTQEELAAKLTSFIDGKKSDDIAVGHVKLAEGVTRLLSRREKEEFIRLLSRSRDPRKLASMWAEGLLVDWQGSPSGGKRISLPTYPFAGKRHWIGEASHALRAVQPVAGMHPMVDTNESTFERQLFKKTFHDRDFFIYDHHVSDIPTLPGVAYLELARKAGELAAGRPVRRIQNILWVSPITVENSASKEVFIELKPSGEAVQFEVFSETADGKKLLHSQGKLLYTPRPESAAEPEFVDLQAIRAACTSRVEGASAYPLFKSVGLNLGPSFQVLQEIYKSDTAVLGVLKLPEVRQGDLANMVLHPSLVDGSLQAGMAARMGEAAGEMLVPYSIGEVEILHPLLAACFSYTTEAKAGKKASRVLKSNVLIVDGTGKVLTRIHESTGVPLGDVHGKAEGAADADGFAKLYYAYEWEKAPLAADAGEGAPQSLLLFDTDETLRDQYQARLTAAGAAAEPIILVRPGEAFRQVDGQSYELDPRNNEDFSRLFASLAERDRSIDGICFAWPVGKADLSDDNVLRNALERGVSSFLFLCQAVIQAKLESKIQLLYLYATTAGEAQPHNEAMSGFIKTLQGEYPRLVCKTVEVEQALGDAAADEVLEALWAELHARTPDAPVVRYEAHERYVRKLTAFDLKEAGVAAPAVVKEKGVYLITGGAGGLGLIFAEYLAREYKARLILTGRTALSAEREAKLDELRKHGAEVLYLRADVADGEEVRTLIGEIKARFGELNGVIHSAGVVRDSYIRNKTAEEMSAVFAPKVQGTLHLDKATRNEALDFFVLFSSLAAVTGNVGQCDYSFANRFMDSFAADRERLRAAGERPGRTLSLDWSLWADGGMKPDEQTERLLRSAMGMKPLAKATGLEAFMLGLASDRSQVVVVEGIQAKLEQAWEGKKKTPAPAPAASTQTAAVASGAGTGVPLAAWFQEELTQIVIDFLKLDPADMAADKILLELGFDSIGLTTFANMVNDKFGLDITPILFFDYPSVGEIAKHLADERKDDLLRFYRGPGSDVVASPAPAAAPQPAKTEVATTSFATKTGWNAVALDQTAEPVEPGEAYSPELRFVHDPIAIVGMSGVMPESADLDEFWANLHDSKDLITVIPRDRWRWEDFDGDPMTEANKSNSRWGGFMKDVDKFDPLFFGISPREAQMMDPQQRIFLEQVWKAVEDSGQKVSDLSGTRTGLFLGVGTTDYATLLSSHHVDLDGYTASGNSHSISANRVSFLLNLRGPSAPIDTACSSSLVAFHRALESIHTGSCDMAIVGGVQVMLTPAAYVSFSMAGMLSPDGKCHTFDKQANGYVRGEGGGAVFLKRLSAAEADGNPIYAVIRSTAENHGGRVTTMTAPNSAAQTELLIEAYEKAHIDPTTVGYIECHGTGTGLGDPIEVQSLTRAFAELYKRNGKPPAAVPHCGLSSVKTNIGHLETGAGIAGVLKAVLAIKHRQIPATLHLTELNPYINLGGTPFYIADKLTAWNAALDESGAPLPLRAGVSSFGFGGANAHVVLEEYIAAPRPALAAAHEPQLIVLSARNEERLTAYIRLMHAYLEHNEVELIEFAYTLQAGRDEMAERLAVVASSTADLKEKLAAILAGGERPEHCYRQNIKSKDARAQLAEGAAGEALIRGLIERGELSGLGQRWVAGTTIDWRLLYTAGVPRRISVPTYPFARERHWMPEATAPVAEALHQPVGEGASQLHPLIHRNVSTLTEQKFASRFTGAEFFLADHRVMNEAVMPAVAYIEMAAAAGELSGERRVRFIHDITWLTPITVGTDAREVEVALTPGRNEVDFVVRTVADGNAVTHCRGKLAYLGALSEPAALDVAEIQARCSDETIAATELYPFLATSELRHGAAFQVVQQVFAGASECLAVLRLPEQLAHEADQFRLHPSLLDGALQTAIGMVKRRQPAIPWSVPYSVREIQIFRSLGDAHYAHISWDPAALKDGHGLIKIQLHLLDQSGNVLLRMQDFAVRPFARTATSTLQSLLPVWSALTPAMSAHVPSDGTSILLLGGVEMHLDWVRESYPNAQRLQVAPQASIEAIEQTLSDRSFDHLLWIAPDAGAAGERGGDEAIIDRQEEGVLAVFRIIKALLQSGYANKKLQWTIVTSGTERVVENDPARPAHAGIIGLVGSLAKEYPHWDLRLLDVDSLTSVSARDCLSLPWDPQGNALAHRAGEWFQQGLQLADSLPEAAPLYRQGGVYVVIGGAGGVGEVWSRFMIERYQAHVVWIGRRKQDAAIDAKIDALGRLGPAPVYVSADARDAAALQQVRAKILESHPAIHGVVQSAIVLQDQSISRMEEAAFRASLAAKVDISVNMDRVFGGDALDFMLFFSSIISFFKSPGQSNYAAGCTFKDSFAQQLQRKRSYPVKIMNWGYWGSVGVAADELHNMIMARLGMGSIEPAEGMAALEALVGSGVPQIALIKMLGGEAPVGASLTEAMTRYLARPTPAPPVPAVRKREEMTITMQNSGSEQIRQVIVAKLSEVLRLDAAVIRGDAPLADYGVDSIIGVNFVRTLNETLKITLGPTELFEYSTVDALAEYIVTLSPVAAVAQTVAEPASEVLPKIEVAPDRRFAGHDLLAKADSATFADHRHDRGRDDHRNDRGRNDHRNDRGIAVEPVAIIGMSGRFAQSETLEAFWEHLAEGRELVRTVSRWSASDCVTAPVAGQAYCTRVSSIDSADQFDPAFFGIPVEEATYMDPQQRLFLEESWKALEDAGYSGKSADEKQCGVYVGCGASSYSDLFGENPPPQAWWGNSQSIVPARIAYHLNLQGPAVAVDSACSSALVAIHLACQALWSRETEMALAGGVYVQATSGFHQIANRAGMLSPDGKCYSFDARANGFVPGEAVGVVVLKRLRDAVRDGDHIHGVIAGTGINQDGKSNGLIAPNVRAQERLERSVYERFAIDPDTIQVVEAHGTGTLLGDSIEHEAITRAFREQTARKQFCAIGSVKTNIGHAGNAAGIGSVLKVLLSLKHRQIPPSLNFATGNPMTDFASSPFYVNTQLSGWQVEGNQKRRGAVSSFGFSGTNAHLVIEEAPPVVRPAVESPAYLIVLSARTSEQLTQQVRNLLAVVKSTNGLSMNDVSFSLFVGRMHLSHRLSCVARTQAELAQLLEQWLTTGTASHVSRGELPEGRVREQAALKKFGNYCIRECNDTTDAVTYRESLAAIADLYVQGYALDYPALFSRDSRRVPLPTYPFARERYWVDGGRDRAPVVVIAPAVTAPAAAPATVEATWLFTKGQPHPGAGNGSLGAAEKMELFLQQETALQLQTPIQTVAVDQSFFDLGLPSLAIVHLIRATNGLIEEELSPSALFEYTDIQGLAAYLARTYPATIDALTVSRRGAGEATSVEPTRPVAPPQLTAVLPEQAFAALPEPELNRDQILEQVLWHEASSDESYEIVTF